MLPTMEIILPSNSGSGNVPAFLAKLWKMVDDPSTNHLISWSDEGNSFIIHNQNEFATSLLPYYYKHSNLASFVRQLNMYGFHKVVGIESGGLKSEKQEEMEFAHNYFLRGMDVLLDKIKRKVSSTRGGGGGVACPPSLKTEKVNEVLGEVSIIRERQEEMDSKLESMKTENEALWREVVTLRQKHQAQQKIVNKLIHFLVSMVQPRMGNAVKRRYQSQLAIEDGLGSGGKEMRLDPPSSSKQGGGPVIKEVTHESARNAAANSFGLSDWNSEELVNIQMPDTPEPQQPSTANISVVPPTSSRSKMSRPVVSASMRAVEPSSINPAITIAKTGQSHQHQQENNVQQQQKQENKSDSPNKLMAYNSKRPTLTRELSKEDIDMETHVVQKDIDNLKDILSGQITLDSNFLTSLFNPEEPLPNMLFSNDDSNYGANNSSSSFGMPMPKLQLELDSNSDPPYFELDDITGVTAQQSHQQQPQQQPLESAPSSVGESRTPPPAKEQNLEVSLNTPVIFGDEIDPLVAELRK